MRLYIDGFRGLILKQKMHKNLKKQAFMQKIITEQRFYTLSRYHGANGDTELFEKPSNINGFETFGQQIFLLLTS